MKRTFTETLRLVQEVECKPWEFVVACYTCGERCSDRSHVWYLQAKLWRQDADSEEWGWGFGSQYPLTATMSVGEVVKKCFVAADAYAAHEVREAFKWRGRRILGPHIDINALWFIADQHESPQALPPANLEEEQAKVQVEKIMRRGMMETIGQEDRSSESTRYPARGREGT